MSSKVNIGEVLMLRNGNRAIILHQDDITQAVIYYDYTLGKNCTISFKEVEDKIFSIGVWDIEWPKEIAYCDGIASVTTMEAHARILGDKKVLESKTAIERLFDVSPEEDIDYCGKLIWSAEHQEFCKRIEVTRGDNFLKIMRDTYNSLGEAIDAATADTIIMRVPVEFNFFCDYWEGKRYLALYTRFSLLKNNEQVRIEWGDKREERL